MAKEIIYLTAEGYKKLKDELDHMLNPLTYIGLAPEFVDRVEAEFGEKANS